MGNKKRTNKRQESDVWKGLAAGLIGGLVASWTMNRFQALVAKAAAPSNGNQGEDEDATQKLAQALATRTLHRSLTKAELQTAGPIVHYTYGTLVGGLYGAAAEQSTRVRALAGAGYGTALWAIGDEIAVPAFGLSRPSTEFPPRVHVQALTAHLVYGVTTELVRRAVRALM